MLTFSVAATASGASPYAHQLVGQCFASQAEAVTPFLLPDGTKDANMVAFETPFSKSSTWVIDKTSGHNYQWYLLEKSGRGHCYTLYIPFAAEVEGRHRKGVLTIQATTQPSPGSSGYQMAFRKSAKLDRFVPYRCSKTRDQGGVKAQSPRYINCLSVADE
jgi:hypothetical protein